MSEGDAPKTLHFFVDEAGDPTLFNGEGRILIGEDGCSRTFILGKLDVDDPIGLHAALERLRAELLADPYFKRVPSMQLNAARLPVPSTPRTMSPRSGARCTSF